MRCAVVVLVTAAAAASAVAQVFTPVDPNATTFTPVDVCAIEGAECTDEIGCCEPDRLVCRSSDIVPGDRLCLPRNEQCYKMGAPCDAEKWCCGAEPDENGNTENIQCKPWEGDPDGPQDTQWYCQKIYYEENDRCMGEEGRPYIVWRDCADGLVCRKVPGGLWGSFCAPPLPEDAGEGGEGAGEGDMDAGEGDMDAGEGDMDAGEGDMDAGEGDMDAGEGGMGDSEGAGDGDEGAGEGGEGSGDGGEGSSDGGEGDMGGDDVVMGGDDGGMGAGDSEVSANNGGEGMPQ